MDFGGGDQIRFERRGRAGIVTMTRPKALNAVTHQMVLALARALDAWEGDDAVDLVIIKGEGRAFSAGGDILHIYETGRAGRPDYRFFADEYRLNLRISEFKKPYVALIDGIVMGGGVGVSVHGSHRVMTENAAFAMPEVGIGFFPDVGGSYFLPRLKDAYGFWLGLTGNRIKYGDALFAGVATHAAAQADLDAIETELAETGAVDSVLDKHAATPAPETEEAVFAAIARHFGHASLEDVLQSLRDAAAKGEAFAASAQKTLAERSPTSLNVTMRQISSGAKLTMAECMAMEYRIVSRMLAGHDFYEGIRTALIDKAATPQWRPARLEDVEPAGIDAYFASLGEKELAL
ncbi:enoyl-CoA hydratase/isomerase family protein [Mesorhizobium xinjiangense]|uniref:enoyl-CoA hydratase/isomerase family protein n=1 Tax=Mesorhizobium xinjiangense TaxID=2678685 RepID=UPI0012EEA412|nr:enoyl-CoA hydratase/isomerase family protein [Mesorhizobium xinjiangense]